jgi:hypothetical protein
LIADPTPDVSAMPAGGDSAGRIYATEIELLGLRGQLLDRARWAEPHRLAVSGFWLDESRATAMMCGDQRRQRELAAAAEAASATAVRPKLLILLEPAPGGTRVADSEAQHLSGSDDVRKALIVEARRPRVGPLLQLSGDDSSASLAEAAAAVAAMS